MVVIAILCQCFIEMIVLNVILTTVLHFKTINPILLQRHREVERLSDLSAVIQARSDSPNPSPGCLEVTFQGPKHEPKEPIIRGKGV